MALISVACSTNGELQEKPIAVCLSVRVWDKQFSKFSGCQVLGGLKLGSASLDLGSWFIILKINHVLYIEGWMERGWQM